MFNDIVEFIKELYKGADFIPLHEPYFGGNEKKYLEDCIDSTYVSSVGKYVDRFEEMMCEITGSEYAVAVVNGTSAIHVGLKLLGVRQGDEVLTQPLTFVATANAISYQKAIPHFVDVDEDTLGLSPIALKLRLDEISILKNGHCYNKITGNRISACVPMHTFGLSSRIDEIVDICNSYNIPVLEDAAEALGSTFKNRALGSFGQIGAFSFNGNKTLTCGGGGAIVTNDIELGKRAKHITTTAKVPHKWEYVHDEIGFNYRMPNLNAALACAQLEQLDMVIDNKRETAKWYHEFFESKIGIKSIIEIEDCKSNYWLNAIKLDNEEQKNSFLEFTNSNNLMTRPIWKLINELDMYKKCPKGAIPNAMELSNRIVNIPSSFRNV